MRHVWIVPRYIKFHAVQLFELFMNVVKSDISETEKQRRIVETRHKYTSILIAMGSGLIHLDTRKLAKCIIKWILR